MIKMSSKYLVDIAYRVLLSSTSHIRKHSSSLNNTFLCSDIPESVEKNTETIFTFYITKYGSIFVYQFGRIAARVWEFDTRAHV